MDKFKKIKKKKSKRNYVHQVSEERLNVENVEDMLTKKIDNPRKILLNSKRAEYDCNSYDPHIEQEKLNGIPQLSKNEPNLDFFGNSDISTHKCNRETRKNLECESQVYCDDRGNENDLLEHRQKKQRLAECSSQDTESNHLDLGKRKRHKQKKIKAKMLSSASVWKMGNEATESSDHRSGKTGIRSGKTDPPSCSETNVKYTDVFSDKKKKFPNPQLDHTDRSEIGIREEFKQIAQSSVKRKLTDVTETIGVHLSKNKKSKKTSSLRKKVRLDSKELSHDNINKKGKKQKHILSLGTETIAKGTEVTDDCQIMKKKVKGENHQSSSCKVNTCSSEASDDNLNRNGMESCVNEGMIFTVNPYENKQYDRDCISNIDRSHCQLSESDVISVDDFDFDDEHYTVPFRVKKSRIQKKSNSLLVNHGLITSDEDKPTNVYGKDIGLNAVASYSTSMYSIKKETDLYSHSDEENAILSSSRSKHSKLQKNFDEMLYTFPSGEGIPPEEIEEIPEEFRHWKKTYARLDDNEFTVEEIRDELQNKINYVFGYFRRLEENNLTEKEVEEVHPRNFHGPYLPTYKHLEFFETLDIKITWALNPLHQSALGSKKKCKKECKKKCKCEHTRKEESGFHRDKSRFKHREIEIIIRNWIKFQEEYGFYDLRPMVSLRTARILKEGSVITFQPFRYMDTLNERKFAVYLSQGLPERSPTTVLNRMRFLTTHMMDNVFKRTYKKISGRDLGKMVLMLKMYGKNFLGIELIVGHYTAKEFLTFFQTHIWMQNIELRRGLWIEAETVRLKKGIFDVLQVKSLEEAIQKRINWVKIMPYVRTRNYRNMRAHLLYEIGKVKQTKKKQNRKDKRKIIEIVYESDVDSMDAIDWHAVAQHFPDMNPYRLLVLFRKLYHSKVPHKHRLSFEDGIKYLYEKVRPTLLPYVISSTDTNDGVSCEGHAEAEVEIPAHTAFRSGIDESSESADGNINDFECETKEDSETSENCSIHKDIVNNSDLIYSTDTKQKRNANSVVENQKLVNTKASLLGSSYQIQCSKAHYMSASESE